MKEGSGEPHEVQLRPPLCSPLKHSMIKNDQQKAAKERSTKSTTIVFALFACFASFRPFLQGFARFRPFARLSVSDLFWLSVFALFRTIRLLPFGSCHFDSHDFLNLGDFLNRYSLPNPWLAQWHGLHENDRNHEEDDDDSDSHKQESCWIRGDHGNYGSDENHWNPGCKPQFPKLWV